MVAARMGLNSTIQMMAPKGMWDPQHEGNILHQCGMWSDLSLSSLHRRTEEKKLCWSNHLWLATRPVWWFSGCAVKSSFLDLGKVWQGTGFPNPNRSWLLTLWGVSPPYGHTLDTCHSRKFSLLPAGHQHALFPLSTRSIIIFPLLLC